MAEQLGLQEDNLKELTRRFQQAEDAFRLADDAAAQFAAAEDKPAESERRIVLEGALLRAAECAAVVADLSHHMVRESLAGEGRRPPSRRVVGFL